MKKSPLERHGETLEIDDFVKFAKDTGFKYITSATIYDEDGMECRTSLNKSINLKWKQLKKKWRTK